LERRRLLAVERVLEGHPMQDVADFLGVQVRSVQRWVQTLSQQGVAGLAARPVAGRPAKLTATQEKIIRRWLAESPLEHGFPTELWTATRLAALIQEEWDITLHPRYLCCWLRARGLTPQKPRLVPRERDDDAIAAWLAQDWPRIKKRRGAGALPWCSWTKAGC
jgi:transposase